MNRKPTVLSMKSALYNYAIDKMYYEHKETFPMVANELKIIFDDNERLESKYPQDEEGTKLSNEEKDILRVLCSEEAKLVEVPINPFLNLLQSHNWLESLERKESKEES